MATVTTMTAIGAIMLNVSTWYQPSGVPISPLPTRASNASGNASEMFCSVSSMKLNIGPMATPIMRKLT